MVVAKAVYLLHWCVFYKIYGPVVIFFKNKVLSFTMVMSGNKFLNGALKFVGIGILGIGVLAYWGLAYWGLAYWEMAYWEMADCYIGDWHVGDWLV